MACCSELEWFTGKAHRQRAPGISEKDPAELWVNYRCSQDPAAFLFGVISASSFVVGYGW